MDVINLTGEPIRLENEQGTRTNFTPRGCVYMEDVSQPKGWYPGMPAVFLPFPTWYPLEGLPAPRFDRIYLVKPAVLAHPDVAGREDVFSVSEAHAVYDEQCRIVAYRCLVQAPPKRSP